MAAILQTIFSNAFSRMKIYRYQLRFHWSLFARVNNIPALVQIIAWRRSGDKPLSEPMMVSLLIHICVTRPQGVSFLYCQSSPHEILLFHRLQGTVETEWWACSAKQEDGGFAGCYGSWTDSRHAQMPSHFSDTSERYNFHSPLTTVWFLIKLGPNKMVAIMQRTFPNAFSEKKILIQISPMLSPKGPSDKTVKPLI